MHGNFANWAPVKYKSVTSRHHNKGFNCYIQDFQNIKKNEIV